ncbi:MAG: alpha/beta hydrolase [Streptosporangiaceae bacterium]
MGSVHTVDVDGGALAVEVVSGSSEPVLAIHGISSQRKLWNWLRSADPGLSLIAPDLRGRGDSTEVRGPFSISRHAADIVAILDRLGLDAVHVCGMSMGGFVAIELATSHPGRVKSLILVDGGFPMAAPPGLTRQMLPALFGDRLARQLREWPSVREYAEFFVANTAPLLDPADPLLLDYLAHDLVDRQVRLSSEALVADAADIFFGPSAWQQLRAPTRLLTAEWSTGAGSSPAYAMEAVQGFRDALPGVLVAVRPLAGVDHAASIMSPPGAKATAGLIRDALTAAPAGSVPAASVPAAKEP